MTVHGRASTYIKRGCRCDDCTAANTERGRRYRERTAVHPDDAANLAEWPEFPPPPGPWAASGSCVTTPLDVFFPARGESVAPALRVCAGCPVLAECREYALTCPQKLQGVWGGMSENQRRKARRGETVAA